MSARPDDVKSILDKALDVPEGEARSAFLDEACRGDAALRLELDGLLNALDRAGKFLNRTVPLGDAPADSAPGGPSGPVPVAPTDTFAWDPTPTESYRGEGEVIGTLLAGRYKLVETIGEGGMGSVFLAQQTEPVKRLVAVKVIKSGMDSKAVLARFEAERQALAMMDHPNIARVLDAGTTETGRPFFVMELVKGVPITTFCDDRRLTPGARLELFAQVCNAIQHAHQKGVIHRDIKPNNVLVAMYDDRPVPKVIDFGVAKATGVQLADHTLVTGFGAVVGTPEYMSPEQASFNQLDVDTRSDVYALGVLLYELLTGSPPFTRKELEREGVLEIFRLIREQEPRRPSTRLSTADGLPGLAANRQTEPRRLTAMMKGELDWIVMKALEKDRSRRYETANGFAADVQRYLAGEAVQAVPPSGWYRLKKTLKRNRSAVVAGTLVFGALVCGVIGTSVGLIRAEAAKEAEAHQRIQAETERDEKEQARAESDRLRRRSDELLRGAEYQAASIGIDLDMDGRPEPRVELLRLARRLPMIPDHSPYLRDFMIRRMLVLGQQVWSQSLSYGDQGEEPSSDARLAMMNVGGATVLLETFTGRHVATWRSENGWFPRVPRFVAQDRLILTEADENYPIEVRDTTGRRILKTPPLPYRRSVVVSSDGRRMLAALSRFDDKNGTRMHAVQLWDVERGNLLEELAGCTNEDESVKAVFGPEGATFATAGKLGLRVWSAADGKLVRDLGRLPEVIKDVSFSPNGRVLVAVTGKKLYRWTTGTWTEDGSPELLPDYVENSQSLPVLYWYQQDVACVYAGPSNGKTYVSRTGTIPGRVERVEAPLALSSDRVVYDLQTGKRLPTSFNQRYHSEITRFAINNRFLNCGGLVRDLLVDKTVLLTGLPYPDPPRTSRELVFLWSTNKTPFVLVVPLSDLPPWETMIPWARLVCCGELAQNDEFVPWDEGTWEENRKVLHQASPAGEFEYYLRPVRDPLYWLRGEIDVREDVRAKLPLLDRLIRLEPRWENFARRAATHNDQNNHLAIRDALEAGRLAGVLVDPFPPTDQPSWKIVLQAGLPGEHYQLALRWEEARRQVRRSETWWEDGTGTYTTAAALYRLGRYADALAWVWSQEQKTFPAQVGRSVLTSAASAVSAFHGLSAFFQPDNRLPMKDGSLLSALQAMCYHKLGQPELARSYLDEAAAQQKAEDKKGENVMPARREIPFYREAAKLITGKPPG
jgi:serine/threonine protein kinase